MDTNFETIGYFTEYFIGDKYIGTLPCERPTNELFGYCSQELITLNEDITLENKKRIKKNTEVKTFNQVLCGKLIKKES